jgi:hypothetical protein
MKTIQLNKLAFNKLAVAELNEQTAINVIGGSEDMPVPTVIRDLTKISLIAFIY